MPPGRRWRRRNPAPARADIAALLIIDQSAVGMAARGGYLVLANLHHAEGYFIGYSRLRQGQGHCHAELPPQAAVEVLEFHFAIDAFQRVPHDHALAHRGVAPRLFQAEHRADRAVFQHFPLRLVIRDAVETLVHDRHGHGTELAGIGAAATIVGGHREHRKDLAAEEAVGFEQLAIQLLIVNAADAAGGKTYAVEGVVAALGRGYRRVARGSLAGNQVISRVTQRRHLLGHEQQAAAAVTLGKGLHFINARTGCRLACPW